MARIFLDTNYFIDAIHRKPERNILSSLQNSVIYISPLSLHIYCYVFKLKIPSKILTSQIEKFQVIELSENIIKRALEGPTPDFEDNIQLHSAAESECYMFYTEDKALVQMKFFGKVRISST